jgi:hypothetical protein
LGWVLEEDRAKRDRFELDEDCCDAGLEMSWDWVAIGETAWRGKGNTEVEREQKKRQMSRTRD